MVEEKDNFVVSIGIGKDGEAKIKFSSDVEVPLANINDLLSNLNPVLSQIGDKDTGLMVELTKSKAKKVAKKKKVVKSSTKTKKVARKNVSGRNKASPQKTTTPKKKKTTKRK